MKSFKIFPVFILLTFIFFSKCNTTEPPPKDDNRKLTLTFEDASCTEVWLRIETENVSFPAEAIIKTDDSVSQIIILGNADTVVYVDSLLPNKTYTFKAELSNIQNPISSNDVTATTMDTTSHNFTWQSFTLGDIGSSTLYDVVIIAEDNIWCVGDIKIADTSENGYTIYNAVHWDGNEWTLKRIMFYTICGQQHQNAYPASSILEFSETEIWIAMKGDQIAKIENGLQTQTICLPWSFSINKIWGTNSNDLYAVGNNGNIAHFNGRNWQKIESGTELNVNDIYGANNEETNEYEILAVASNILQSFEKDVIKINNTHTEILNKDGIDWTLSGIWFKPNKKYYAVGSGIYEKNSLNEELWRGDSPFITNYHVNNIEAIDINDVFIVGAFGEFLHFNGFTWKSYINETGFNGTLLSLDVNNNLVIAVGYEAAQAKILIGHKKQ